MAPRRRELSLFDQVKRYLNYVLQNLQLSSASIDDGAITTPKIAAGAINDSKMSQAKTTLYAYFTFYVIANNGAGARVCNGAVVGDELLTAIRADDGTDASADLAAACTTNNQWPQVGSTGVVFPYFIIINVRRSLATQTYVAA